MSRDPVPVGERLRLAGVCSRRYRDATKCAGVVTGGRRLLALPSPPPPMAAVEADAVGGLMGAPWQAGSVMLEGLAREQSALGWSMCRSVAEAGPRAREGEEEGGGDEAALEHGGGGADEAEDGGEDACLQTAALGALLSFWLEAEPQLLPLFEQLGRQIRVGVIRATLRRIARGLALEGDGGGGRGGGDGGGTAGRTGGAAGDMAVEQLCELVGVPPLANPAAAAAGEGAGGVWFPRNVLLDRLHELARVWATPHLGPASLRRCGGVRCVLLGGRVD
jgi:hypothetical protein